MFIYSADRRAIPKGNLMELCVDGNWKIWIRDCGGVMVSIYVVREGSASVSNLKASHSVHGSWLEYLQSAWVVIGEIGTSCQVIH